MKVTYTEEAIADIVDAITFLNERNPTAAADLDADILRCVERLAGARVRPPAVAASIGRFGPELGGPAVSHLLSATL